MNPPTFTGLLKEWLINVVDVISRVIQKRDQKMDKQSIYVQLLQNTLEFVVQREELCVHSAKDITRVAIHNLTDLEKGLDGSSRLEDDWKKEIQTWINELRGLLLKTPKTMNQNKSECAKMSNENEALWKQEWQTNVLEPLSEAVSNACQTNVQISSIDDLQARLSETTQKLVKKGQELDQDQEENVTEYAKDTIEELSQILVENQEWNNEAKRDLKIRFQSLLRGLTDILILGPILFPRATTGGRICKQCGKQRVGGSVDM